MKPDKSLAQLTKELDDVFRKYIQLRDEGKPCFICGAFIKKGNSEVCHYIRRANLPTRFHVMNAHLGCIECNRFDEMHEMKYEQKLVLKYGIEKVVELESLKRSLMKPTRSDLIELLEDFKLRIKELSGGVPR
jgi:5-methylcytosine-specific restriction endonuclease McrA